MKEKELYEIHYKIKKQIIQRLNDFSKIREKGDEFCLFKELVFCLLTPQSKAKICWDAVERLEEKNLLFVNDYQLISNEIKDVRFRNNKAKYIILAKNFFLKDGMLKIREKLELSNILKTRDFLVENIKGLGYKEASHFLRNIGYYDDIAILDRHILKNMLEFDVIKFIPKNVFSSRRVYLELEEKLKRFALQLNIQLSHLDFILWYRKTGEVFK